MSVLAFKAIGYGAEQIPDKFFEKIPGGFFTPAEKKKIDDDRDKKDRERHRSEQRPSKRSSRRDRSPTDDSQYSAYDDSNHETEREREREQRKKDRSRRARSAGRSASRSMSRGRHDRRSSDLDGQYSDSRDMAYPEQGSPYFPPPPGSDYRPYNPQDYAAGQSQGDYRPSSPSQSYGYPPQVNIPLRSFSATSPTVAGFPTSLPTPPTTCPPMLMSRPLSNLPSPLSPQSPSMFNFLHRGTPVSASFLPSTDPPLAALLARPFTNTSKPAAAPPHSSASASRYTPGPGYAPSPPVNSNIPAPPIGTNAPYTPYNPSEYGPNTGGYEAPGNAYASPPPFTRHRSNSQPTNPPYPAYAVPIADQRMAAYDSSNQPSSRRGSTKPRREHRHRARSADTHSSSRKDSNHNRRDSSRMTKLRERFDDGFLREGGLAATVGGALAGSIAGRQLGGGRNKLIPTILGGAAGAFGGRAIAEKRSK
jgi:hypothetical protein